MSASRNIPLRRPDSPAGLPAPEDVKISSISGAGLFIRNHERQLGPQLDVVPAPRKDSLGLGAGLLSVLTADLDLTDIPADFERVAENRFCVGRAVVARRSHKPEVVGSNPIPATTHNPESLVQGGDGNLAVPAQGAGPP